MKNTVVTMFGMVAGLVVALILVLFVRQDIFVSPFSNSIAKPLSLKKYTFPQLRQSSLPISKISITKKLDIDTKPPTYQFTFHDNEKKVSGVLMLPPEPGEYPVCLLYTSFEVQMARRRVKLVSAPFAVIRNLFLVEAT